MAGKFGAGQTIAQWVAKRGRRQALQGFLRRGAHGQRLVDELEHTVDSFAKWRWTTLAKVLQDLLTIEEALEKAVGEVRSVSELACRDSREATAFVQAVRCETFWARTHGLAPCVWVVADFGAWVKGCSCHEADRRAGRAVDCQWAGCRAPEFSVPQPWYPQ